MFRCLTLPVADLCSYAIIKNLHLVDKDVKTAQPDERLPKLAEVYNVVNKVSDDGPSPLGLSDGYARPDWMILIVMPVPSPPVRPSILAGGDTMRSKHDLAYKLGNIINALANVRRCEEKGALAYVIKEFEQLLQVCIPSRSLLRRGNDLYSTVCSSTLRRICTTA